MATIIKYNNIQIASGQPVPLVQKDDSMVRYGERWCQRTTLTLNGQLTGCSYESLLLARSGLVGDFTKNFQNIEIEEDGESIFSCGYVIVRNIEFPDSQYSSSILDYSVTLECYQENLFSGTFGILEPNEQWEFEEDKNGLINATHTISAKGLNTSSGPSNSLQNAIDFVNLRTGLVNFINPHFISSDSGYSFCLKSINERINRFESTYSIIENYIADKFFGLDGILRYTIDFECSPMNPTKVSIQGQIDGCGLDADVSQIRQRYYDFRPFDIASGYYNEVTNATDLNSEYISSGVSEDIYNRKLTFNISFDNTTGSGIHLDYAINIDSGENGVITVEFDGNISSRGDLKSRWERVLEYYSGFYAYPYGLNEYNNFGGLYTLNPEPITSGATFNKFIGQIAIKTSWSDKDIPPEGFRDFSYTLSYIPQIQKVSATPLVNLCNKSYYISDLGYSNRVEFSVEGNGVIDCDYNVSQSLSFLNSFGNSLFGTECPKYRAFLENNEITTGISTINFKFGWSAEGTGPIALYSYINKLNL